MKKIVIVGLMMALASALNLRAEEPQGTILDVIRGFEGKFDPKCYATASRLEDFMFGIPLSDEARFRKNDLLKGFVQKVWKHSESSGGDGPTADQIDRSLLFMGIAISRTESGDMRVDLSSRGAHEIRSEDFRQYGSVAYSLRAILAVQQASLLAGSPLPALSEGAVERLKQAADLVALVVLREADRLAAKEAAPEVRLAHVEKAWEKFFGSSVEPEPVGKPAPEEAAGQPLLRRIIEQKRASYAAYNKISNQLFVRNLQVYFARLSWPKDAGEARAFRQAFTESVIAFAGDFYRDSAKQTAASGKVLLGEREVAASAQRFLPHEVNEYEDVIFFPRLGHKGRVVIESYDFDAFRDSGIHWHYLGEALNDLGRADLPDADPFAAEILAENIAQFGVLVLRVAGKIGNERDEERLSVGLLEAAMQRIQESINRHASAQESPEPDPAIASARDGDGARFVEVHDSGIVFMHRSSDWLNRLLRSYLEKGDATGVITIPPAFGGSGVAAGDVNGDGEDDLLLLSGLGNRLYLGRGGGRFEDFSKESGLEFRRGSDQLPGEPRQPLIADFDNDGHQDVLITFVGDAHQLFKGRGDGTFANVTAGAGLGGDGLVGGPATCFDFDNDGLLDLYISYFGDYLNGVLPTLKRENWNGLPNRLFRNIGGMKFEDVTEKAEVGDRGWGQGVTHTDLDGDGWQDLISGNDFGVNRYYRNRGDGTFEEISKRLGTDKPSYTMSLSTADLNGDLVPEIYVSNIVTMNKDEKYVLPNADTRMKFNLEKLAHLRVIGANDLFVSQRREDGEIGYSLSRAVGRGYSATGWAWDADFFDADLDGDDDLYVLNGMNEFNLYSSRSPYFMDPSDPANSNAYVPVQVAEPNVYFENSKGKLNAPESPSGLEFSGNSRSAVYLDWDSDGDLDVVTNNYHEPARLFENTSSVSESRWIKLKLQGDPKQSVNSDAIGARVILRLSDGRTIWREIQGSTGYMSVHPKTVHAGLGSEESVDVEVIWPNGKRERFGKLAANKTHRLRIGAGLEE